VLTRDVRNRFFYFNSVSVRFLKKNYDSVQNEFGSVWFKKRGSFGYYSYLLLIYTHIMANITATVDDMTLTSLTSLTTATISK